MAKKSKVNFGVTVLAKYRDTRIKHTFNVEAKDLEEAQKLAHKEIKKRKAKWQEIHIEGGVTVEKLDGRPKSSNSEASTASSA